MIISVDEILQFHEQLNAPMKIIFNTDSNLTFLWTLPAIIILSILGMIYINFFMKIENKYRNKFFFSEIIYLSGAILI